MNDKISNKVMKVAEFDNAIFYRANCGCGSDDCGLTLELEYDPEINMVSLNMYQKLAYCSWFGVSPTEKFYWFKDMYNRIKGALKLFFTGKIELEESFLFRESEQIDHFILALQEGMEKIQSDS
jgi:hypothetical protein